MYGFYIDGGQVRRFMKEFLKGHIFDDYRVISTDVFSIVKFHAEGNINPDFLKTGGEEEKRTYCLWGELKPYIFGLIKGSIKPRLFKTVLSLPPDKAEILHPNAASMHLSVSFENDRIIFISGTSQKNFRLSKDEDLAWEMYLKKFFIKNGFMCETLE